MTIPSTYTAGTNVKNGPIGVITERKLNDAVNRSSVLWDMFGGGKRGVEVNSRKREVVHYLSDGQVGTFRPEGGTIPLGYPGQQVRSAFGYVKYQHPWTITPEAKAELNSSKGIMSFSTYIQKMMESMGSNLSGFLYGDGSGAVAVINPNATVIRAAGAGTVANGDVVTLTVTEDTVSGVGADDYGGVASNGVADVKLHSVFDVWNVGASPDVLMFQIYVTNILSSTTFKGEARAVNASAASAGDTHLVHGSAVADGDICLLTPPGTRTTAGTSYACHGLAYHLVSAAQTEWQTLNPSTDSGGEMLRSMIKDMDGASLTPGMMNFIEDAWPLRHSGDQINEMDRRILVSVGQFSKVKSFLNAHVRTEMGNRTYTTGATKVTNQFGEAWRPDPKCPDTRIYGPVVADFDIALMKGLGLIDWGHNGDMQMRPTGDAAPTEVWQHVYDGGWEVWFELASRNPHLFSGIIDLGVTDLQIRRSKHTYTV